MNENAARDPGELGPVNGNVALAPGEPGPVIGSGLRAPGESVKRTSFVLLLVLDLDFRQNWLFEIGVANPNRPSATPPNPALKSGRSAFARR